MPDYAPVIRAEAGPYKGAALVGTHSISLGWSFDDEGLRQGLRGFAIRRSEFNPDGEMIELRWLGGFKRFAETDDGRAGDVTSLTAPFQRFRWNEYTLRPERLYRYEVFPMRGTPANLERQEDPLVFDVVASPEDDGDLGVYVNRGVTAAKAYFQRFGDVHPRDVEPKTAAYGWLSRGLKESLLSFIQDTQAGEALHVAIYEFVEDEVVGAFKEARDRGVDLKIVYHATPDDKRTAENEHVIHHFGVEDITFARTPVKISHNKLVIRLVNDEPVAAWTGSANFTENAFNFQTNAALVVRDQQACQHYEDYFQNLLDDTSKADSKIFNRQLMTTANAQTPRWGEKTFFSPISQLDIIDASVDLIESAEDIVLVSAPFGVHKEMKQALLADTSSKVQYGLANSTASSRIADLNAFATRFFPPKKLTTYAEERWDAKAFGAHKIHAKTIVTDPFGDNPKVFFGSANFSNSSCKNNDENAVLIEGDKRLAAILATEFMRMYDHYKARWWIDRLRDLDLPPNIHLKSNDSWSDTAFDADSSSHKLRDRLVFSGG